MTFPTPINPENVGTMVAVGLVGNPPTQFVFSAPLKFSAGAAENTAIATLSNAPGDTLSIVPADDKVRWDGNVLEVGAVASPAPGLIYYTLIRTRGGVSFSQVVTIAVI